LAVPSLIVLPSSGLLEQLESELFTYFEAKHFIKINSKIVRSKQKLKQFRLATVQTLASLNKTDDLDYLISDVHAIFIDEIHHSAASSYINLLSKINHIYYRFGFTGTFLRNDGTELDMWGFLSNVLYTYPASKAIEDKYLVPMDVKTYTIPGNKSPAYIREYNKNYCGNSDLFIQIVKIIHSIAQDKQILILVGRKDK